MKIASAAPNPPMDVGAPLRMGLLTLLLGFGGFSAWAALAPLDEGVPLSGQVTVESNRKTVQHLTGGIVRQIMVREGDHVRAGNSLLELDTSSSQAEASVIMNQLSGLQAQSDGLMHAIPQLQGQRQSLQTEVTQLAPLVAEDLYPRNSYAEKQRQLSQLTTQLTSTQADLRQSHAKAGELHDRLAQLQREMGRARITAPVDGIVMGLNAHTIGGIIQAGSPILEIVPSDDRLVIEAQIPPQLIEVVHAGLDARLRFIALNPRMTPVIMGSVDRVSADRFVDKDGKSYYTARIRTTPDQLRKLGKASITPGMPVEVIVLTGERTFMNYLLKPLSDRMALALKER